VGVYAAVSRRTEAEDFVLPDEQITPLEALTMYTRDAAKATFDEEIKGSIEPGKLADLVVLSGDPTKVPANEIKDIEVEMTILDGEVVWDKIS
jgi:predicted amidohydrolase YtcJ